MTTYSQFKQTGLSRYITIGKAPLKPVEPAPPPEPPKLKKTTFRVGRAAPKQPPKRVKGSPEVILCGAFIKFNCVKHDGFVIGKFKLEDSAEIYTVRGVLPVVDQQYCYQLRCTEIFKTSIQYRIESLHGTKEKPALSVLPITGNALRKLLIDYCGMKLEEAQQTVFDVYKNIAKPGDYNAKKRLVMNRVIIEFDYLCKNFTQEKWFQTLEILWAPLRYRNFPKLMQLGWDTVALGKLNSVALAELSVDLQLNPWSYLVPDRNRYNLPAIPIANIPVLNHLFGTEIGEVDIKCIQFYHKVSEFVQEHKQISLNANQYFAEIAENEGFAHEIRIATLAPRRKLVKPHWEQNSGIEETRYYRAHELEALLRLPLHFNRLYRSSVRSIPRPKSKNQLERNSKIWENFDPNPQQLECYNRLQKHNVLLIDGGPGSGKSTVMQILRTLFADSVVGFFAAYGVIANGLSEKLNIEFSTLAMAVDQIERNTSGASAFLRMEVAFIDEISLVDVILLDKFLSVMTGLKVLVMAGDYCQSSCIGPGPIIYGMLKKWTGTPYVQQLVKFYRTKNPILLDNLDKLRKGRYDIQYSTRLDSDHPFIIQQRHEIPKEIQKTFTQAARLAYVSILMKDIEPIYRYYMEHDPSVLDNAMLCTQRIHDVSLLNHAWWCIKFNKNVAQDHYSETEFTVGETVMFCGNNLNDPDYQRAAHLRSSRVMHGSTAVILAIWDFLPYWNGEGDVYRGARSVISTSETKEYYMDRVIQFTNGTQINLRDYPLSNFKRGYAVTTSSTQGLQCELLIYYVQPGRTRYLTRQEFYTGCSRSKTRVIIICEANSESLHTSDLARISRNEFRLQFDIIPIYLPPFKEKVEQDEWAEVAGNPFENLPSSKPTEEIVQVLSNSSLFGGFFAGLKLVGSTIIDETAQSGF